MNHSGLERKTLGLNNFIGQLTFLLVILLVGFLEVSLISSDWLETDNFFLKNTELALKRNCQTKKY